MKWRDRFIGAFSTLIVTVVGGVILYYLTRESPPASPAERLVYDIDSPVIFDSELTQLSLITIRAKNVGDKSAANVRIGIDFTKDITISDQNAQLSSGPAGDIESKLVSDHQLSISIPTFTPNESATISILTRNIADLNPTVAIKSDDSTGEKSDLSRAIVSQPDNSALFAWIALLAIIAQVVILYFIKSRLRSFIRRHALPTYRSLNNTAFVFIHSGLVDEAADLLSEAIKNEGAQSHILANYALAIGLQGDIEKATLLLAAAEFWADNDSEVLAIVSFNRAILAFKANDSILGTEQYSKAFNLSNTEICRYSQFSNLVADLRLQHEKLNSLLSQYNVE